MISNAKTNKKSDNLFSFLPSDILYEIDENISLSNKNLHKDSNVSNYLYN